MEVAPHAFQAIVSTATEYAEFLSKIPTAKNSATEHAYNALPNIIWIPLASANKSIHSVKQQITMEPAPAAMEAISYQELPVLLEVLLTAMSAAKLFRMEYAKNVIMDFS